MGAARAGARRTLGASCGMARPLRVQFPGARYHVIDRGNYRHAVFGSVGAAQAFTRVLAEAAERHAWCLHAHALIPNHFHLALETPEANLAEGMHWLLGTFANRYNRFRGECGPLFPGRYQGAAPLPCAFTCPAKLTCSALTP